MVSLYINDKTALDIRPTKDIDVTFQITSTSSLEALRELLVSIGFRQSAQDSVICRFRYKDILVDVMSTQSVRWAPSNIWFAEGFEKAISYDLDGTEIKILPLPYFLATKMEALFERGVKDIYASHDLEDIVYLFNYTVDISDQILAADTKVKEYLQRRLQEIIDNKEIMSAFPGSLYMIQREERMESILERIHLAIYGI